MTKLKSINKREVKIKIQNQQDRANVIIALANNGYKVGVENKIDDVFEHNYYVKFEL